MSRKSTHTQTTDQAKHVTDADLTFIFNGSIDKANKIAEELIKKRTETKLIIVCKDDKSASEKQAALTDLMEKGRCLVVYDFKEYEQFASNWIYIIDESETINIQSVINSFSQNKKKFTGTEINAGVFNKKSGTLPGSFLKKTGLSLYNLAAGIAIPAGTSDLTHQFFFFSKSFITHNFSAINNTALKLLCRASYLHVQTHPFVLGAKEHETRKTAWKKIPAQMISARINWFVKEPIRYFKAEDAAGRYPLYRLLFFALFIIALLALPYLSQQFGMTWDEKRHNQYGYQMLDYYTSLGSDTTALSAASPTQEFRYYGEHFNLIAAFLNTYVSFFDEYETRHLLNALYGLLAMLCAALCAKEIGSWRTAFFALALILCSPVFVAHSMNNPTDIPFAAGSAMALYYLLKIVRKLPNPGLPSLILCGVGIGIAIGARVGGIIWYAYAGLFLGINWLQLVRKNGLPAAAKSIWPYGKLLLTIIATAHIFAISLWPFGHQKPFTNWYLALKESTKGTYFTYNHELFEGVRRYMADVPLYYLPKFIFINTPESVWAGIALLIAGMAFWKKKLLKWNLLLIVFFVTIFPILYAEAQSMYYYNGWRHYLFVFPPIIILAASGWETLAGLIKNRTAQAGVLIMVLILCAFPVSWMIKNHPNQCVYFNQLSGGTSKAYGQYELDYYSNSCRAAAEWLAQKEPNKKLTVAINNEPLTASYYSNRLNPNINFVWVREYEEYKPRWDYLLVTTRTYSSNELRNGAFPPKGTVHVVQADGVPLCAIVKRENNYMPDGYDQIARKSLDSSITSFKQAIKYEPLNEEAHRMLALAYLMSNQFKEAEKELNEAIKIFPENFSAYVMLGQCAYTQRQAEKAIPYFKKALTYKVNLAEAYFYMGQCQLQLSTFGEAAKSFEDGLKYNGSFPEMYHGLGSAYLNLGNYTKAEKALTNALQINGNFAPAYQALAQVFERTGEKEKAAECQRRYEQLINSGR